jgi:predicted GIY-YIG superfamily endonuclease
MLELPADIEPFLQDEHSHERIRGPAVYCLRLTRPDDLAAVWDAEFDTRPDYWDDLTDADGVLYVGSAKDLLSRLNDHADGEVRLTVLTTVCEINGLRNVWWVDDPDRRFIEESQIATMLQNQRPDLYTHSR